MVAGSAGRSDRDTGSARLGAAWESGPGTLGPRRWDGWVAGRPVGRLCLGWARSSGPLGWVGWGLCLRPARLLPPPRVLDRDGTRGGMGIGASEAGGKGRSRPSVRDRAARSGASGLSRRPCWVTVRLVSLALTDRPAGRKHRACFVPKYFANRQGSFFICI